MDVGKSGLQERRSSNNHHEKNNCSSEKIALDWVISISKVDFWRHITCFATFYDPFSIRLASQSKINQLQIIFLVEHQIFDTDISMSNALAVNIANDVYELFEIESGNPVRKWARFFKEMKESTIGTELKNHPSLRGFFSNEVVL